MAPGTRPLTALRLLAALAAATLSLTMGCRNPGMVVHHEEDLPRNWKGHHIDQLIHNWGPPSTTTDLDHGGQSFMFEHARYVDGEEIYCWAIFVTGRTGVIRSSSVGGNIANCNWILASGKRSPRLNRGGGRRDLPR